MRSLFYLLASVVSLYSTLCFIRCLLSWIPSLMYSSFGRFLSAICDPWMNLFRRIPLQFSGIDFSAMLSLGALYLISSLLKEIADTGGFNIFSLLMNIIMLLWSVFSSFFGIILIILIIRLLVMIFSHESSYYGSIWTQIDSFLGRFVFKISNIFTGNRNVSYRTALIISIFTIIVLLVSVFFLFGLINRLLAIAMLR